MWPFGKKKEKAQSQTPENPHEAQIQDFAQQFEPEELDIVALTGPVPFGGNRTEDGSLWVGGIPLVAWVGYDEEEIHQEPVMLSILADDRLFGYLRSHVPSNFIIKTRVRRHKEKPVFQLIGMPEPGFDPDLKALMDQQKAPVTYKSEQFGTFTLIRSNNWFDTEAEWNGMSTRLVFLADEKAEDCLKTAATIFPKSDLWDKHIQNCATQKLLPKLNARLVEKYGSDPITEEELLELLEPDVILVHEDGTFEFTYGSSGTFGGQMFQILGSLSKAMLAGRLVEE